MKRAKIALMAIAVMAIAGGVYASKARQNHFVFVPTIAGGQCTFLSTGLTTDIIPGVLSAQRSATLASSTTCNLTTVYVSD